MKVGVTGHQDLGTDENVAWVRNAIAAAITELDVSHGFTCLARGADQLYAEVLMERGIPFTAVIPCEEYEETFPTSEGLARFKELLGFAANEEWLPYREPSEVAFFDAGKRVVDCSKSLIAAWDGEPAKGLGGTADVVEYAMESRRRVIQVNPRSHMVRKLKA